MPQLIKYIDHIAREKQRDVLYLEFSPEPDEDDMWGDNNGRYSFRNDPIREKILDDLTKMGVTWLSCGGFADENYMASYAGQVYLDVPFDKDLPLYQTLETYLEHPDGSMRFENVRFYALRLELAMKNAHHDEPGFWEKWAEDF
jgi:hypothetical protein